LREGVGDEKIQPRDQHETYAGNPTQGDLRPQDRGEDDAITFLLEPQPIHEQVDTVREKGQEDQEKQNEGQNKSRTAVLCHG
jgi:hypothetical protein